MDTTDEDYVDCGESECKAPNKMFTSGIDSWEGLHYGQKLKAISSLRAELND